MDFLKKKVELLPQWTNIFWVTANFDIKRCKTVLSRYFLSKINSRKWKYNGRVLSYYNNPKLRVDIHILPDMENLTKAKNLRLNFWQNRFCFPEKWKKGLNMRFIQQLISWF